jgi:hypothetical protein
MAKAFRTVELIRGKEPMLRQLVSEARYSDGQLYLDHCGRLLRKLLRDMPEWVVAPEPTPQGTTLHNLLTGTQLGFGREAASLSLDRSSTDEVIGAEEVTEFVRQVEAVLGLVLDELEVTSLGRMGYREYHHFSFDTKEDSERWLEELGLVSVSAGLFEAFKGAPEALGVAIVLQGETCRYRIGLNGVERPAQVPVGDTVLNVRASAAPQRQRQVLLQALREKRQRQVSSAFAAVLDVDAYLLEPADANLARFAREQSEAILPLFRKALSAEPPKKRK